MEAGVVLQAKGICMTFPGVKALDDVTLTLKKGEIRALMGENGAGKSTLIKCLTGVNKFEAGEIYLEGFDKPIVNRDTMDAQKKGISTVYQEVNLCPNLTVAENLFMQKTLLFVWEVTFLLLMVFREYFIFQVELKNVLE